MSGKRVIQILCFKTYGASHEGSILRHLRFVPAVKAIQKGKLI